jgi:alcohol dehydrogenase class IV
MPSQSVASYDFIAPPRIVFGWGRLAEIGRLAAPLGRRAFLIGSCTMARSHVLEGLCGLLAESQIEGIELATIAHEPEVADVDDLVSRMRALRAVAGDLVIAVGGGSAIDLGKAAAALATNAEGTSVCDYLEGVGRGLQITVPPLPLVAVPTTAGTGSEATKNAVISSYDPPFKKSLRSDLMMARLVVIDPQLTISLPPAVTAHTGMDAITQLIESYLTRRRIPQAQLLAVEGLRLANSALEEAFVDPTSRAAREAMSQAALYSGMALANSGLGMAHGVAAALGVHLRVAHGLACAVMLPVALRTNRVTSEPAMAELARASGIAPAETPDALAADKLIARIDAICRHLQIPARLSEIGVMRQHLPALVRDSRGNSMNGNPRALSDDELSQILEELL